MSDANSHVLVVITSGEKIQWEINKRIAQGYRLLGPVACNNMPRFDYYATLVKNDASVETQKEKHATIG